MSLLSRRQFLAGSAGLAASLILPSCSRGSNSESENINLFLNPGAPRRPDPPFLLGLYVDETRWAHNLHQRELDINRGVDTVLTFAKIQDPVRRDLGRLMDAGYDVCLTLEFWDSERKIKDPRFSLSTIMSGDHDADLRRWAEHFRGLPRPIHFRPLHEGNADWYPWGMLANGNTPAQLAPAFKHVVDVVREVAQDKVLPQFCVNRINAQDAPVPLSQVYPGDEYVSELAIDGYNRPEYEQSVSFSDLFRRFHGELKTLAPNKPLWVGETGCTERHGNKAAWIVEMFSALGDDLPFDCLTWFDKAASPVNGVARDWQLTSSPQAVAAFRAGLETVNLKSSPGVTAT